MPRDETDMGVIVGLSEGVAEGGLGGKIHVSEKKLADEVRGDCGGFSGICGFLDDFLDAVVEETDREGAEVVVWREEGGCLWGEGGGCGGGLGEGGSVVFVCNDGVEGGEGEGFPATVGGSGWF